jgi:O-antigen/teichoic acid export membrane protein
MTNARVTSGDVSEPPAGDEHLRSRVLGGLAWGAVSTGIAQLWRIVGAILLARLLTPHEYGLAGMALVFSSLVLSFSDLSMGAALVQRRTIDELDRSTVFWTTVAVGTILTVGGIAISGLMASFYRQPTVQPLFIAVSFSFLLVSLQTTQASLLQRELRFRAINLRVAASVVIGGVAGVVAAFFGAGAWALIIQQLTLSFVSFVLLWVASSWRPKFVFSRKSFRSLGGFGVNLLGARVLDYANRNTDNILVGRFLGPSALGAYSVAYNLMFLPLDRLILPIQDTLFPAYARWQEDLERLAGVWLRIFRMVAALVFPAMVGLAIVAPDFVAAILGTKWSAAVPVLQILCAVAIVQSLAALGVRVLSALDRTHTIFRFAVIECAVTIPAFAVGLHWGIVGVATCYTIVTIPLNSVFIFLTIRALDISITALLRTIRGVALATAVMAGACLLVRSGLADTSASSLLTLLAVAGVGAIVYIVTCRYAQPQVLEEIRNIRRRRAGAEVGEVTQ